MIPTLVFASCTFLKVATPATLAFDAVILVAAGALVALTAPKVPRYWSRLAVMTVGVLTFELFTSPLWINEQLGRYAYVFHDVSWIMTALWATLLLATVTAVDRRWPDWRQEQRFAAYLGILLVPMILEEVVAVQLGIRRYAPEVWNAVSGITIAEVPIEILYYVPVFTALVIGFAKYWDFHLLGEPLVPTRHLHVARTFALAGVAVILYELMVEPAVMTRKFPTWSYLYRDISLILVAAWTCIVAFAAVLGRRFLSGVDRPIQFAASLGLAGALALPFEAWLIHNGYRAYSASAVEQFTGQMTVITDIPVEVAFAIPCYLVLVLGFIRFWESVQENPL